MLIWNWRQIERIRYEILNVLNVKVKVNDDLMDALWFLTQSVWYTNISFDGQPISRQSKYCQND